MPRPVEDDDDDDPVSAELVDEVEAVEALDVPGSTVTPDVVMPELGDTPVAVEVELPVSSSAPAGAGGLEKQPPSSIEAPQPT